MRVSRIAETNRVASAALLCLWLDKVFTVFRGVELCAELDGNT